MSSIHIRRKHGRTLKQAKAAVTKTAAAISRKFSVDTEWERNTLHFRRPGVNGAIEVGEHEVQVRVELGFLMGALKGTIENEIQRVLDENFV